MKSVCSFSRAYARVALLFTVAIAASAPSAAAVVNRTLTISGTPPASVTNPNLYSFQPVAYDSVKSRLHYIIWNKPAWAQLDMNTGRLSGRPNSHEVGTYSNIRMRLIDWYGYTEIVFSIQVLAQSSNKPPTISGHSVASVPVGTAYNFKPAASDAEHNPLTFSVQNMPSWMKFSATSGALIGTPTAADVGSYAKIQISVSDGKASASLPAFTVTVDQIATGNVTVDWTPPTENSDGSVLTELAGYRIHYGASRDQLTQTANITNPGLTSYVVEQLTAGTWYFNMTAYSKSGVEGSASGVVSTMVQ
jgi:Putative Ig domain